MPTYKFQCTCGNQWTERQALSSGSAEHTAECSECNAVCENLALGGTGFQFTGRHMNKRLHDFPDHTNRVNRGADADAEQMEKLHDVKQREDLKKDGGT